MIREVHVSLDATSLQYDKKIWDYLVKDFTGMNKIMIPWYRQRFRGFYIKQYPRLKTLEFGINKDTLSISVIWKKPRLYVTVDNGVFGLVDNLLVRTSSATGSNAPNIILTSINISNQTWWSALFFLISPDAFAKQVQLLYDNISGYNSLSYIPWASKLIMEISGWKKVYFDLSKNMIEQLNKYRLITWTGNLLWVYNVIDAWTMNDLVFLGR